jgi:hypothetical protein|tara:strand:- start:17698 stop:17922 length:225 start_codon:yes stop_codon:yes gene_type:complete
MIKEVLAESLRDETGWSSKRLTTLVLFAVIIIMGFIDMLTKYKVNIAVFETFAGMTVSYSGMSLFDKVKGIKNG